MDQYREHIFTPNHPWSRNRGDEYRCYGQYGGDQAFATLTMPVTRRGSAVGVENNFGWRSETFYPISPIARIEPPNL